MATSRKSDRGKRTGHSTAALIAESPVNVVDISRGGCLLETTRSFDPGTVGTLHLTVDGHAYVEDFRVARCTALSGRGSTFRVGLEFLRTHRTPDTTLRHAIARLVALNAAASAREPEAATATTRPDRRGVAGSASGTGGDAAPATAGDARPAVIQ